MAYYTKSEISAYYGNVYTCAAPQAVTDTYNLAGARIQLTWNGKSVYVIVADLEPYEGNPRQSFDLTQAGFSEFADPSVGVLENASWRLVSYDSSHKIAFHVDSASNDWWIRFRPFYQKYPIAKFEVSTDDGASWTTCAAKYNRYAFDVKSGGALSKKYTIRTTDILGTTVTNTITVSGAGRMYEGGANF